MAAKSRMRRADPVREAAAEFFAGRSHDGWRRTLLKTNPEQKGKPRMRLRGGVMVDVNQPWSKLHAKAKAEQMRAGYDAYDAVRKFPGDREAASNYVHECWIKRNRKDPSQPKALFKPYDRLPEVEKDKDRAHVDVMLKALRAVSGKAPRKVRKLSPVQSVRIDAKTWRRLETAARDLSKSLGREVSTDVVLSAAIEAFAAVSKAVAAEARAKKA